MNKASVVALKNIFGTEFGPRWEFFFHLKYLERFIILLLSRCFLDLKEILKLFRKKVENELFKIKLHQPLFTAFNLIFLKKNL
jgi:hypothetical protein